MAGLESSSDGILVTDGTTGSVDEPCTLLEVLKELGVDQAAGTLVKGAVDGDDITLGDEFLEVLDTASIYSLGGSYRQSMVREGLATL